MENVPVALVIIFIFLFGGLTFSEAFITAQETINTASQELESRANDIRDTALAPADLTIVDAGSSIDVVVKNTGSAKLADFDRWDVFVDYYDDAVLPALPAYHSARLTYDATQAAANSWAVSGIYHDWDNDVAEVYEPNILNPGEEIRLHLKLQPAVGVGQTALITVATGNGVTTTTVGQRNAPPTLTLNTGFRVADQGTVALSPAALLAEDTDNTAAELTLTITTSPAQGTLTPATAFTQAQIDAGEVTYTHTGSGDDSFDFTVSDGIDVIGPFTATIAINQPPQLTTNAGLTLPTGTTATITNGLLQVTDNDDTPDKLIYTITQFPANGALSLGSTFSQNDVDGNRLTYTSANTSSDLFKFIVSDGYDVIGTYTFVITVVP